MQTFDHALTKAYSLHDLQLRSVGISNKGKNGSIYPVLTWGEFRSDMYQTFIVNGHYTKHAEHSAIYV